MQNALLGVTALTISDVSLWDVSADGSVRDAEEAVVGLIS
jgi:hypothetical protein